MSRRALAGLVALGLGLALAATVAWLGPGPLAWTARAIVQPPDPDQAWAHVSPEWPITVVADLPRLLRAQVMQAVRPELDALARARGIDLRILQHGVGRAVSVHDGDRMGYTVVGGMRLAPILLARVDAAWHETLVPGHELEGGAATDGVVALAGLGPGVVLACRVEDLLTSLTLARRPRGGPAVPRLPLADPALALRAEVRPDAGLRATLRAVAGPLGEILGAELERGELTLAAAESVRVGVTLDLASAAAARRVATLLDQAALAARASRRLGPFAGLIGGRAAGLLADLPSLAVTREERTVRVEALLAPEELRSWLARAAASAESTGAL